MVAIVSGNSLGLSLTSLSNLGQGGSFGSSGLGRSGEQGFVNIANGNLVLQDRDEWMVGRGLDMVTARTYNSQGSFDDNNDTWRLGFYRGVSQLTGTLKTVGSTVSRTDADGAVSLYRYDTASAAYVNTDGSGAHDILNFDSATQRWTWTDGDTRVAEVYDWIGGSGKLLLQTDPSGNSLNFTYDGSLLNHITDQNGEKTALDYIGKNLAQIRTIKTDGSTSTRVRYGYDAENRLSTVLVDLSPEDNSIADGRTYLTTYTYDGTSNRLASVSATDGTHVEFTYAQQHGTWRVVSATQTVDGIPRTTSYDYVDTSNTVSTTVVLNAGQLSTTDTVVTSNTTNVDATKLTSSQTQVRNVVASADGTKLHTTDTISVNQAATLDSGKIDPGNGQSVNRGVTVDNTKLSTTEPQVNQHTDNVDGSNLSTIDMQGDNRTANLDGKKLSTTQTQQTGHTANVDGSRLSTMQTQTTNHAYTIDASKLSTSETQTTNSNSVTVQVAAHYVVQNGDTWESIAGALYGSNTPEAAAKLKSELNSPSLTAGSKLVSLPATLSYDTSVTVQVAAHYVIQNGDTWESIAGALYGSNTPEAVAALQIQLGNPELISGRHVANLPVTLNYNTSSTISVPAHYPIQNGDTWTHIASILYGTTGIEAGKALQAAMGNPILLAGAKLTNLPATLSYATPITVPAYYRINNGDTWTSIASSLYHTTEPEAAIELQTALGNPVLTVGLKLVNLPATISYTTTTIRVPTYYRIQAGDTWASITNALYRTNDVEAVSALQSAMSNQALTAGDKLANLPYTLYYTVVEGSAYYLVKDGDDWGRIAGTLYGRGNIEAADALKAAQGNRIVLPGDKLRKRGFNPNSVSQ